MKNKPKRDLNIVGDFLKYSGKLFIPFFIAGSVFGYFNRPFFLYSLGYPLIYSAGISLILIVLYNDINDVLSVVGLGKAAAMSLHVKHAREIQDIAILISGSSFNEALKKVNALLRVEPQFPLVLNMKGQILLEGFGKPDEARNCFNKVLSLTNERDEQYKLADSLIGECDNPVER